MQQTHPDTYTPRIGNNSEIEFAVWLLIQFGIHYPPFTHHEQKPNPCITDVSWYQWLRRLIRKFDGRLHGTLNYQQTLTEWDITPEQIDYFATPPPRIIGM